MCPRSLSLYVKALLWKFYYWQLGRRGEYEKWRFYIDAAEMQQYNINGVSLFELFFK